jgi:hypothetical protein
MLRNLAFITVIFISHGAIAADYKILWKSPINQSEPWVALSIYADQSGNEDQVHLAPTVDHITEKKDPFSEEQIYMGTKVSCKIQMILINLTDFDIGARGRFGGTNAPITAKFIFSNKSSHYMQGNFAFTNAWSTFKQSPILTANDSDLLELVSLSPYEFSSKNDAQKFLDSGGCNNFNDVDKVEVSSIPLDVMRRGTSDWISLTEILEISILK